MKSTNLSEINVTIYDRWVQQVCQVVSEAGTIEWDGKTAKGKDAAEGVYLYILTAKEKDGQSYKKQGSISLFR